MLERVILSKALAIVRFISPFFAHTSSRSLRASRCVTPNFAKMFPIDFFSRLARVFQDLLDLE